MNLQTIDKARYRKHLNWVYFGGALGIILITVPLAALLVYFFGAQGKSNIWFDFSSAFVAAFIVLRVLSKNRRHHYLTEVAYVWELKQQLNLIQRKQKPIDEAAKKGDHNALIILNFQYRGSKQIYQLDDNVITLESLNLKIAGNDAMLNTAGLSNSTDLYEPNMLNSF